MYRLCDAEKLNLSSDVGDSSSKKYKRDYDDAYGGGLSKSTLGRSLELGTRFCVDAFGRNLVLVAVKMFSRLIYIIETFHNFIHSV